LLRVADFAYFNILCAASHLCPLSKPLQPILPSITMHHQLSCINSIYLSTIVTLTVCQPATMRLLRPLVLLQVLVGVSTAATDLLRPNVSDAQVAKRWFTVPDDKEKQQYHPASAWPHTIPYCFEDDAASKIIGDLLPAALAKWKPAMQVSSLAFAPDSACTGGNQSPCLCSTKGINEVTVHLRLGAEPLALWEYRDPTKLKKEPSRIQA
jgi:hypothetical protein